MPMSQLSAEAVEETERVLAAAEGPDPRLLRRGNALDLFVGARPLGRRGRRHARGAGAAAGYDLTPIRRFLR
jgi:hypothetical protein